MTTEIALYNIFMVLCFCFTAFHLGRAYEITLQIRENEKRHVEDMISIYKNRG